MNAILWNVMVWQKARCHIPDVSTLRETPYLSQREQRGAPNPHTNLMNVYIQIANKMVFNQKKISADRPSNIQITGTNFIKEHIIV
jgi:hypothetical protein